MKGNALITKKNTYLKMGFNLLCRIMTGFIPTKKMRKNFRKECDNLINNHNNKIVVVNNLGEKHILKKIKGLHIDITGFNNTIIVHEPYSFSNSHIIIDGDNNEVELFETKYFYRNFYLYMIQDGANRKTSIGENFSCEGLTIYQNDNNSQLIIGNNCMFSHGCFIQCCDSHLIYDSKTHEPLNTNYCHNLEIGNNVWIAQGATILKSAQIPSNSIVGCNSVVCRKFNDENVSIAGIPAIVIKNNIKWSRITPNTIQEKINTDKIQDNEITFVVQGAINKQWTKKCLTSIRKLFPLSFIILSTWENSDTLDIEYLCDKILYNRDPKGIPFSKVHSTEFNLDRQIISSLNGLKEVTTKYSMKLRSDMIIKNRNFLKYFNLFKEYDSNYKLFEKRIVSFAGYSPYTSNNKHSWNFCIHDFAYFGLTNDLLNLWNIPLMTNEEKYYWELHKYPKKNNSNAEFINESIDWGMSYKFHAEQYITIKNIQKIPNISFEFQNMYDFKDNNIEIFNKFLANNFIPLYPERLGISLPKNEIPYHSYYMSALDYTYNEFLEIYNKYANGRAKTTDIDNERIAWSKIKNKKNKIYKFLHLYWLRGKK